MKSPIRPTAIFVLFVVLHLLSAGCQMFSPESNKENRILIVSDSGGWHLHGTMRFPEHAQGACPAVLLLHQFSNDSSVYKSLAEDLAREGIASLRIDLRGHGESTNQGGIDRNQLLNSWPDVTAALRYLRKAEGIDGERLGTVSASYSGEAVARAGLETGKYPRANVVLSSGTMTISTMKALRDSDESWWFIAAEDDSVAVATMRFAARQAPNSRLNIFSAGGHGTRLLTNRPELQQEIVAWLAEKLGTQ